ncbi:hypothetical protein HF086_005475 [Spodoptera exigua]|uniref:Peptidase M20 dimerisation domain-containing protein n=1 Tax=Spodoptera exigua TaxID=7107 RepID=A0A922MCP3_SPOEX|nr:hypothetical protein HF086_005475 [Spodoptera exigua]
MLQGGIASNVIATEINAIMDMRLASNANPLDIQALNRQSLFDDDMMMKCQFLDVSVQINSWLRAAGNNNSVIYIRRENESGITSVDDTNPFWVSIRNTLNGMGIELKPVVKAAMSDAVYIRNKGIPTIGFATKTRTIHRLHAKDEYQNVETFLRGIDIYTEVLKDLANVP